VKVFRREKKIGAVREPPLQNQQSIPLYSLYNQVVQLRHVIVEDPVFLFFSEISGVLCEQFLRPRSGGVAVRKVVGPQQPAQVAHGPESLLVLLKANR